MATNTAASFTNHTGNGSAGPFSISFSYLAESDVDVTVGGVLKTINTHYTFTSASQITFTSGNEPANGVAIKFQRDTNISTKKVDFVDGSVLTEADLDANSNQLLFSMQEIIDSGAGSGFTIDSTNKVDGSVVYYDSSSAKFKADSTTTKLTIVDGGSF
tara:strand:+ start:1149 stop:1625 length:477 start_codon:yes stop_codon:yes gene_type:complete